VITLRHLRGWAEAISADGPHQRAVRMLWMRWSGWGIDEGPMIGRRTGQAVAATRSRRAEIAAELTTLRR
jgi:hypothetical protein